MRQENNLQGKPGIADKEAVKLKQKAKHNYNVFTKDELVKFMNNYENNFLYIDSPYDVIIGCRMDEVMKKMEQNSKAAAQYEEDYKRDKDGLKYMTAVMKHNKEYDKFRKEYDRLSKLRFGS
jgi:hypothetical protein